MKRKNLISISISLCLLLLLSTSAFAKAEYEKELDSNPKVKAQQMEAQIYLFNQVLSEFGATSPDQAIELWAKGDKTRNGVYKFAVMCDELKQKILKTWGPPEKTYWIIGGSSPWLTGYSIIDKNELSPSVIVYLVQYQWATSAGAESPTYEKLTVTKNGDNWCISSVLQSDGYHSCVFVVTN